MDIDEMSAQFCLGLFQSETEQLIIRRLLENADELEIIDELLGSSDGEPRHD